MARPLRIEYAGAFYHVTARGNERRDIYFGKTDYERFKAYLKETQEKYGYITDPFGFSIPEDVAGRRLRLRRGRDENKIFG